MVIRLGTCRRGQWHPTPVLLPGKSHGRRNLVGCMQSMGSLRVGHNWASSLSLFTFRHWRRNGNPLQCSCLENPKDGGAWWAAVYGFSQSQTWLKWLSSSSSRKETDSLVDDLWRSMHTHEKIWSNLCDRFTQVQYAWERLDHWGIASWSWAHNWTTFPTSLQLDVCMWLSFSQWNVHRAMCTTSRLDHKNPITLVFSFSSGFRWMDIMIWKSQVEQNNRDLSPWVTSWRRAAYQSSIIYILPLWEINHLST